MNRELRSAGYNPLKAIPNYVSFVTSFPAPNNQFVVNYATDHSIVAFTLDTNGNGAIDSSEQIAYRFNNAKKTLERFNTTQANPADKWEAVATNIDAVYLPIRLIRFQLPEFQAAHREQHPILAVAECPLVPLTRV